MEIIERMICNECGNIDKSFSAYCSLHHRSIHQIVKCSDCTLKVKKCDEVGHCRLFRIGGN